MSTLSVREHLAFLATADDPATQQVYADRLLDAGEDEMAQLVRYRDGQFLIRKQDGGWDFAICQEKQEFHEAYWKLIERVKPCISELTAGWAVLKPKRMVEREGVVPPKEWRYTVTLHCARSNKEWSLFTKTVAKRERVRGVLYYWLEPLQALLTTTTRSDKLRLNAGREGLDLVLEIHFLPCVTAYLEQACDHRRKLAEAL